MLVADIYHISCSYARILYDLLGTIIFFPFKFSKLQVSASYSNTSESLRITYLLAPAAVMLSRILTSRISPTALTGIVPYGVFSRPGHPLPRSRALLQTHQSSYQIEMKNFSTTRPWFRE
jgi:hypothetical protein